MNRGFCKWLDLFDVSTRHAVTSLMDALFSQDKGESHRHALSVAQLAGWCAEAMALPASVIEETIIVGLLHDIGRIADGKPGPLDALAIGLQGLHPVLGERIVQAVPGLYLAGRSVRAHHERWDGQGFPDRLRSEQIPLSARIVSVADAFDILTHDTSLRPGMPVDAALAEVAGHSGTRFDPAIVKAFCEMIRRTSPTGLNRHRRVPPSTSPCVSAIC